MSKTPLYDAYIKAKELTYTLDRACSLADRRGDKAETIRLQALVDKAWIDRRVAHNAWLQSDETP